MADERDRSCPEQTTLALVEFCKASTIKGLGNVITSNTLFQRGLWIVTVLSGTTLAGYLLGLVVQGYLKDPTTTNVSEEFDPEIPFPDITVCTLNPLGHVKKSGYSYEDFVLDVEQAIAAEKSETNASSRAEHLLSVRSYLATIADGIRTANHSRFVAYCEWEAWKYAQSRRHQCHDVEGRVRPFLSLEFGACVTIHLNWTYVELSTELQGFVGVFFTNNLANNDIHLFKPTFAESYGKGVRVVIHPAGTFPDLTSGFNVPIGFETSVKVKPVRYERLKKCSNKKYLDNAKLGSIRNVIPYSGVGCSELCRESTYFDKCNCVETTGAGIFLGKSQEETSLPRPRLCQSVNFDNITETFKNLECREQVRRNKAALACACFEACKTYAFESSASSVPWPDEARQMALYRQLIAPLYPELEPFKVYQEIGDLMETNKTEAFHRLSSVKLIENNFLQLNIFLARSITRVHREHMITTFAQVTGDIGGILNLWTGISFVTLMQVVELLYVLLTRRKASRRVLKSTADGTELGRNRAVDGESSHRVHNVSV